MLKYQLQLSDFPEICMLMMGVADGKKICMREREREVLLHFPAVGQMAGGTIRVYLYTLCLFLNLDPSS